jgi:hypothetical protein
MSQSSKLVGCNTVGALDAEISQCRQATNHGAGWCRSNYINININDRQQSSEVGAPTSSMCDGSFGNLHSNPTRRQPRHWM